MREETCESGNKYALALGPTIMNSLMDDYTSIIPENIMKKIEKYCKENGLSVAEVLTDEERTAELDASGEFSMNDTYSLMSSKRKHNLTILLKTVRKMNDNRLLKHPYFTDEFDEEELAEMTKQEKTDIFFEEIMPPSDFGELLDVINEAVFEFRFGMSVSEKSKLLSMAEGKEEVLPTTPL